MKQSFFHQDFLRYVDLVLFNQYLLSKNLSEVTSPDKKANNSEQFRFLLSENPAMGGTPDSNRRPSPPQGDALTN